MAKGDDDAGYHVTGLFSPGWKSTINGTPVAYAGFATDDAKDTVWYVDTQSSDLVVAGNAHVIMTIAAAAFTSGRRMKVFATETPGDKLMVSWVQLDSDT